MKLLGVLLIFTSAVAAAAQPTPRDVDITAPDGTKLRASYYAAERPGPAVMLMHMCNTTRKSWEPVARQLSATGISAVTVDNRGFGESGGPRFEGADAGVQRQLNEQWPGDLDAAFAWLLSRGVDKASAESSTGSQGHQDDPGRQDTLAVY